MSKDCGKNKHNYGNTGNTNTAFVKIDYFRTTNRLGIFQLLNVIQIQLTGTNDKQLINAKDIPQGR